MSQDTKRNTTSRRALLAGAPAVAAGALTAGTAINALAVTMTKAAETNAASRQRWSDVVGGAKKTRMGSRRLPSMESDGGYHDDSPITAHYSGPQRSFLQEG
jgi:hypothetical protein